MLYLQQTLLQEYRDPIPISIFLLALYPNQHYNMLQLHLVKDL